MSHKIIRAGILLLGAAVYATAGGLAVAQPAATDLVVRLDQLENQVRQLTGAIEQLQFRNQQLETRLQRMQEDTDFRFQDAAKGGARPPQPARPGAVPPPAPPSTASVPAPPPPAPAGRRPDGYDPTQNTDAPGAARPPGGPGRRSDAFDPTQNPDAVGAPQPLGGLPNVGAAPAPGGAVMTEEQKIGAPGGREAGEPLDLSTLSAAAASGPAPAKSVSDSGPAPQVREPGAAGGQVAAIPPPQSPRDEFDLAYGYILAKDYLKAEAGMRAFVAKYPSDRLAPEAQFWLGESMFQRQSYRDAAEAFLAMSKKYDGHAKAPDALLRLGQSLAALKEKELACATFGEVGRKYPRAGANLKQAVEREQKRVRC